MSLIVSKTGVLDTVQDLGRIGFAKWGINRSGVMDRFAAMSANALVGNGTHEPVIEMHFPASEFYFSEPAIISITGADFNASINGLPVAPWKTITVPAASTLTFTGRTTGFRAYLAVHGGYKILTWLESASTNLKIAIGGLQGRSLRKGDVIKFNTHLSVHRLHVYNWSINWKPVYDAKAIQFIPGDAWAAFVPGFKDSLLNNQLTILPKSDRMGYYFDNEPLRLDQRQEQLSSAVTFGTIQLLPSGKIVCLMADHQTTGGYPWVGTVISAHLPKLAQSTPGSSVRLEVTTIEKAENLLLSLLENFDITSAALADKLNKVIHDHRP